MTNTSRLRFAICVFVGLTFIPSTAEATIDSVTLHTSRDYENADGYTYAEVTVHGSVARADGSVGRYSVPAVIIYPQHRRGRRRPVNTRSSEPSQSARVRRCLDTHDGHLIQMIGLACWKREDVAPHYGFFGDEPLSAGISRNQLD